jgi:hypothetical protein
MIECFCYWFMNLIGYRMICFDVALARGIPLNSYTCWTWYPHWKKGTYREKSIGGHYLFTGYGVDK